MTRKQKITYTLALLAAAVCLTASGASAMHIMEGYLPGGYCIAWGAVCLPFAAAGFFSIKKRLGSDRKNIVLLAICGAFIFVISSLKIPSVTGSCSHMTGTGLGAVLFGPASVSLLGLIVLIFQAVLLAHGGLTTLGANTFSMAVAGPLVSWGIFALSKKLKINRRAGVFLAAFFGDLFTYCITSVQLALAYPSQNGVMPSFVKFLGVFAPTQLLLAVLEGVLTLVIIIALENYAPRDLAAVGYDTEG